MIELPRIALGTVQPHLNLQEMLWGLLEGLRRVGIDGAGLQLAITLRRSWQFDQRRRPTAATSG